MTRSCCGSCCKYPYKRFYLFLKCIFSKNCVHHQYVMYSTHLPIRQRFPTLPSITFDNLQMFVSLSALLKSVDCNYLRWKIESIFFSVEGKPCKRLHYNLFSLIPVDTLRSVSSSMNWIMYCNLRSLEKLFLLYSYFLTSKPDVQLLFIN